MPDGLKTVRDGAFVGCSIEELIFPDSVTELAESAINFSWNNGPLSKSLKKMRWPSGVSEVHKEQFSDFSALKTVEIPKGVTTIGTKPSSTARSCQALPYPAL